MRLPPLEHHRHQGSTSRNDPIQENHVAEHPPPAPATTRLSSSFALNAEPTTSSKVAGFCDVTS